MKGREKGAAMPATPTPVRAAASAPAKEPTYRRQKRRGRADLAFIEINGARRYPGEYGTPESRAKYTGAIAKYQATGWLPPPDGLTILLLVDRYWTHAKDYYRKPDGTPTGEPEKHHRRRRSRLRRGACEGRRRALQPPAAAAGGGEGPRRPAGGGGA
jgi:hypothetical protein